MANEIQKAESLGCLVGLDFDLLKTNLNAVFCKDANGYKLLVAPTAAEASDPVSLEQMIADFQNALGMDKKDNTIEDSISSLSNASEKKDGGGGFDVKKLTFKLNQAFLYMIKEGEKNMECEFALAISVDSSEAFPDLGFIKIKSLSLAVWNSNRKSVLARMGMGDFSNLLPG